MVKLALPVVVAALAVAAVAAGSPGTSIRLIRAQPAIVRTACRDAQARVRLEVTCPTLIPATRYVTRVGLWGELDFPPALWAITFNNGYNGSGYVHWIAGGGTAKAVRRYLLSDALNEVKGLPRPIRRSRVAGYQVATYAYPDYPAGGPNGSHTAAFVTCDRGLVVFASIHGPGHEAAATAMAVDLDRRSHCR